jgi:hypothetical protein
MAKYDPEELGFLDEKYIRMRGPWLEGMGDRRWAVELLRRPNLFEVDVHPQRH